MLLVASSRMRMEGFASITRAMANSCRCPWLRLLPFSASSLSYPSGIRRIKASALASRAASIISPSVASGRPYLIFSRMVPANR
ncbi:hypothetical protein D3C87_1818610 [compost metagenome]